MALSRFRRFVRTYPRGGALFFTRRVNRPAGSLVAALLFPTQVTPNIVSVVGFGLHIVAAALVVTAAGPLSVWLQLGVIVLWQVAFSLDCADGQLARARGAATPFGAWLDIFLDVVTHVLVYGALVLQCVRILGLDGSVATLVTSAVMGGHLIQLFTSWGHGPLGSEPAMPDPPTWLRLAMVARQLLDYGWFLFAAAVLLAWPRLLLAFLLVSAGLHLASSGVQLALNWRRELQHPHRPT